MTTSRDPDNSLLTGDERLASGCPSTGFEGDTLVGARTQVGDHPAERPDLAGMPEKLSEYRLLRKLGEGGMGAVYLAEDQRSNQKVAVKVPFFARKDDEKAIKRFQREARASAQIQHPNVCPVYDVGEWDGHHYLAMAYIEGCNLAEWIQRSDEVPQEEALRIVYHLALGLQAAHDVGVIHRDLKPANVMLDKERTPILMDFGMAQNILVEETVLTPSGAMVGTPGYMAPEQILAERDKIGPATDIYGLGVILYELLTGWMPFSGSLATLLGTIVSEPPPPMRIHCPDIHPDLDQLCVRALAKAPEDRYESAGEFAQAIAAFRHLGQIREPFGVNEGIPAASDSKTRHGIFSKLWNRVFVRDSASEKE